MSAYAGEYFFRNSTPQTWRQDIEAHAERGEAQGLTITLLANGVYEVMSASRPLPYLVIPDENVTGLRCNCQAATNGMLCKHLALAWKRSQERLENILSTMKASYPGAQPCWTCGTVGNWTPDVPRRVWTCGVCHKDFAPEPTPRPERTDILYMPARTRSAPALTGALDPIIHYPTEEEAPEWLF